jgi:ABC-2 type transport system permease protein
MSWGRIWAASLRYLYLFTKLDSICELFYWPALDIFIWGITSVWIQQQDHVPNLALAILTGLVFWQVTWRGNYEVSVNLLQEFWSRNLVNLFSTPLKIREWVSSLMLIGVMKIVLNILFSSLFVYLLYALNVFTIGWAFLPFVASLTLSGWFLGFFSAGLIVLYGQRVQMVAWMMAYLLSPFSAVFYPLSALPGWAQSVAKILPTTYVFEGMREVLYKGIFSWEDFLISIGLNIVYLGISVCFFYWMFEKSRAKGLARFE